MVLFGLSTITYVFAGGVTERDGQNYVGSVFSTMYVQAFVAEGKFVSGDAQLGPEDSDDGTFKNGVWYWAGLAQIKTSGTLRPGSSFQFRAGEGDEYIWLSAKYTGPPITVSNKDGYTIWGTLSFNGGKSVIEIRYIELYEND
jgi:hypothetical protein